MCVPGQRYYRHSKVSTLQKLALGGYAKVKTQSAPLFIAPTVSRLGQSYHDVLGLSFVMRPWHLGPIICSPNAHECIIALAGANINNELWSNAKINGDDATSDVASFHGRFFTPANLRS